MEEKKIRKIFLTKSDFISGYHKGRYDYIEAQAQKNINNCKNDTDVLLMEVKTGSGLKVLSADKIDEQKFLEMTQLQ